MAVAKLLLEVPGGAALLDCDNDQKQKPVDVAKLNGEVREWRRGAWRLRGVEGAGAGGSPTWEVGRPRACVRACGC